MDRVLVDAPTDRYRWGATVKRLLVCVACMVWLHPAFSAERVLTSYKDLLALTKLDKVYAVPLSNRNMVIVRGFLSPQNKNIKASDVILTIGDGPPKRVLPVREDGTFDLAFDKGLLKRNPTVYTNLPEGEKCEFSFSLSPALPKKKTLSYDELMWGVVQANAAMRKSSGVAGFFSPTISGIVLRFRTAQSQLQVIANSGKTALTADSAGSIRMKLDEQLMDSHTLVLLPALPLAVDFIQD
jgi:hypothetical protein